MSDKTAPIIELDPEVLAEMETKQSFVQKSKHFVKSHKKAAIAVVALGGLVGVSALTGRRTVNVTVQPPLELEIADEQPEDQSA